MNCAHLNPDQKKAAHPVKRVWLNSLNRNLLRSTEFKCSIKNQEVTGIISNAAILAQCIARDREYRDEIQKLARSGLEFEDIYMDLVLEDAKNAADLLLPVFEGTEGRDGFVGIDVSPEFSYDVEALTEEGSTIWQKTGRPNIMIQIPSTEEALPAIRELLQNGINVNATFLYSQSRYRSIARAYIDGLANRLGKGLSIQGIASAATFSTLPSFEQTALPGNSDEAFDYRSASISEALSASKLHRGMFHRRRFLDLARKGAQPQLLMWIDEIKDSGVSGSDHCARELAAGLMQSEACRSSTGKTRTPGSVAGSPKKPRDMEGFLDTLQQEAIKEQVLRIDKALAEMKRLCSISPIRAGVFPKRH